MRSKTTFSREDRAVLKAHLKLSAKRNANHTANAYNKKNHPDKPQLPTIHLTQEGATMLRRANRHAPELVAKLKAEIKEVNRKLRNKRSSKIHFTINIIYIST